MQTKSGRTIWQDSFEGTMADVFDFQHQVVAAIAENLQLGATGILYEARPSHPDAQRLVRQAWSTLTRVNLPNNGSIAAELLRQALEIDPDYVPALNLLSFATFTQQIDGEIARDDAEVVYKEIQERVTAIDHEDGLQNVYNAWGLFWDDDEPAHANQHLQIALRTGLNDGEALRVLAGFARRTGNPDAALWLSERAIAIDPTCENCVWQTTENLFYARRFEEAIAAKKQFQAFGGGGYANHIYMLIRMGEPDAALELMDGLGENDLQPAPLRAMAYHSLGDVEKFAESIAEVEHMGGWRAQSFLAEVYAFTGDIDRAFEALDKWIEHNDRLAGNLFLPHWDNLRGDPRWTALRERLHMSEEKTSILDFSPVLQYAQ
jgi:tetratricopeptide (TPR) repeat protein